MSTHAAPVARHAPQPATVDTDTTHIRHQMHVGYAPSVVKNANRPKMDWPWFLSGFALVGVIALFMLLDWNSPFGVVFLVLGMLMIFRGGRDVGGGTGG
jgi:hypothetical protein